MEKSICTISLNENGIISGNTMDMPSLISADFGEVIDKF